MKYIFVDGACSNNGKLNARATYAVICSDIKQCGIIEPYEYNINDDNQLIINESIKINPSNNRGELLAIIHALLIIQSENNDDNYNIYSDSLISVNTINKWYNNRKMNGTENKFKNIDLINIIIKLKNNIKNKIEFIHVRGHQKCPTDSEKMIIWNGNNDADKLATEALNL